MTSRTAGRSRGPAAPEPTPARRFPLVWVAIVGIVLVALVGVVIALGGDDSGSVKTGSPDVPAFGTVTAEGSPLPAYEAGVPDPAAGQAAPVLTGEDPAGGTVTVGEAGQPTLVVFLAHWCPHCQAELPLLVDLANAGRLDGVRLVAVLTGTNADAPNYPPVAWLEREGWTGDVLLDDADYTAASAYGLAGYPFLVSLDAQGKVVERSSGERPADDVVAMADAAQGSG